MTTTVNISDISKTGNYKLVKKTDSSIKYEAKSTLVKGVVSHQVYKMVTDSNREFIGVISLTAGAIINGIAIADFDIYAN